MGRKKKVEKTWSSKESLYAFGGNGWQLDAERSTEGCGYACYTAVFLAIQYSCTVTVYVSNNEDHIRNAGDYGVVWLEATHENGESLTYAMLKDLEKAFELAEDNLLQIGIPFVENYSFHGKYLARKQQKNASNRAMWNIQVDGK